MATINFEQSKSNFVLQIANENKPCVTIKHDGTVINHYEGAENDGARVFYEQLQFEGKTLYKKIESQQAELIKYKELILEFARALTDSAREFTSNSICGECSFCYELDEEHKEDCIVLKAEELLKELK